MNKVKTRCADLNCAKFHYGSKQMFFELKIFKFILYSLNIIPVAICFLPTSDNNVKIACSLVSFGLTLLNEVFSQLIADFKEKAILLQQLYESTITGSTFSKIEYDRESTNEMHELGIRKGNPRFFKAKKVHIVDVPEDISDDYSYLYIARQTAAKTRFLLSRQFYFYMILLAVIATVLVFATTFIGDTQYSLYYIICFWPLIVPHIRNASSCKKASRQCVKICADIDNFFADGDDSIERLARFYFYVQNIEFEMMVMKPIIFKIIEKLCSRQIRTLSQGVTYRFKEAITELKSKKYISQPKGKSLITKIDYDLETLKKKELAAKQKKKEETLKKSEVIMAKPTESVDLGKKKIPTQPTKKVEKKATDAAKKAAPKKVEKKVVSKTPSKKGAKK